MISFGKKKRDRYGYDLYTHKFVDGFDPWKGVTDAIHFYWITTDDDGKRIVHQGSDFYEGSDCDWTMCVYPGDAIIDRKNYRRIGSDAFLPFNGPIDLIDYDEKEARERYFAMLRSCAYLPIEKITSRTPDGMYWMRFDIPPYSKRS